MSCQLDLPPLRDDRYDRNDGRRQYQDVPPLRDDRYDPNFNRRPDQPPLRDDRFDERLQDNGGGRRPAQEFDLRNLLASLDFVGTQRCSNNVAAQWNYETNVNELTQLQAVRKIIF